MRPAFARGHRLEQDAGAWNDDVTERVRANSSELGDVQNAVIAGAIEENGVHRRRPFDGGSLEFFPSNAMELRVLDEHPLHDSPGERRVCAL